MDTIKLEIRNLTKVYPGTTALQDFSAVFHGGNVYALLGKNGSGKSTLVRCISGAIQPTKGKMLINGDYWDSTRLIPEAKHKEFGQPPKLLERSPGHHEEFFMACKGEKPREFSQSK